MNRLQQPASVPELIRDHATFFACRDYQRSHPGCDDNDAFAYAATHWQQYRDLALDYLALKLALAEKDVRTAQAQLN